MKYIIIAFCILLIILALLILIRFLKDSFNGKCCEGCKGCTQKSCPHFKQENDKNN